MHTYAHTYAYKHVHTQCIQTPMHTHMHKTHMHTYMHIYMHAHMHTHVHTHMHINTHAYIHSIVEALHDFSQKHTHELKKSLAPRPNFPKGQTMLSPDFALGRRSQILFWGQPLQEGGRVGREEDTDVGASLEHPMWPGVCQRP